MLTAIAILVDGLIYSSWIFIVALGLTLIFGVMKILNVAHGSFYAFGAYAGAWIVGKYFSTGFFPMGSFLVLLVSAIIVGVIMGYGLERWLLRFMYDRDEVIIVLVTYAVFLALEDVIVLIWGTSPYFAGDTYSLLGNLQIGVLSFSNYDLFLVVLAGVICLLLWWALNRTQWGKVLQAVIHDREMSLAMGINVNRVFTATFVLGGVLGALGGAFTAPIISVTPGLGVEVIVLAFAVVVIGGMGSIPGAVLGALMVGLARAAAVHLAPALELFIIYGVMTLVLAFRPYGLFGQAEARKI